MSRKFWIFVEGGAEGELSSQCRKGFSQFFEKAGLKGKMPRIFASGSRRHAYDDFCHAIAKAEPGDFIVLLIDSEAPIHISPDKVWDHVKTRQGDQWHKPPNATADHLHFMVECMEAWFLADKVCLSAYFGQGFKAEKLPQVTDIERVSKASIYDGLKRATENCKTKAVYGKGAHSFDLLGRIEPDKVKEASDYAKRLIETLLGKAA
ncbi:DUF4276 family protein [Methylomagnum sp.]